MNSQDPLPDPPFDHFGLLAPLYERFIRIPDAGVLRRLLDVGPEHALLDVGGGTGRVARHFRGGLQPGSDRAPVYPARRLRTTCRTRSVLRLPAVAVWMRIASSGRGWSAAAAAAHPPATLR